MNLAELTQANRFRFHITNLFWTSMDWLYPPRCCNCDRRGFVLCNDCYSQIEILHGNLCQKCGYPLSGKSQLCEECRSKLPPFSQMRSWASFTGPVQNAIHSLKYKRNLAIGHYFAQPLAELVTTSGWKIDLVVPIPLSRSRLRSRGYNQAALISQNIADLLNIQHSSKAVKRIKNTSTQIELDVNKRFTNLLDAFYANPATLKKRNVLLIDDVITTGATMQSCSKALSEAGAENIYCLSVARAILRHTKHHQGFTSNSVQQSL